MTSPTIHASAVLIGARAALIRGPSGAGKSRLVLALLQAAERGDLPFARLVGDDRVHVEAQAGRLLVRSAATLEGMIEVYGSGIRRLPFEPVAVVGWVIDLAADDAERLPAASAQETEIEGLRLPRLAVAPNQDPLPAVMTLFKVEGRD